ncbi:hypothetical protein JB92DRAFT_2890031 [Gautieria morchelliformis]|nr:hypothetical protein JB92DRAFT_2890031 [Gautieria morchelliformis]
MTPSQRKYLDVIVSAWGDWSLFQRLLLGALRTIGDRHGDRSIAVIATRCVGTEYRGCDKCSRDIRYSSRCIGTYQ